MWNGAGLLPGVEGTVKVAEGHRGMASPSTIVGDMRTSEPREQAEKADDSPRGLKMNM